MASKFIDISKVDMRFGQFHALSDINLALDQGEFITLIGHSGCGKSTLLNLIAGLDRPSSGVLVCSGREIAGPGPERAVVFQNHSLLPWLTCFENVYLAVQRVFGRKETRPQLDERTWEALELVGLAAAGGKRPSPPASPHLPARPRSMPLPGRRRRVGATAMARPSAGASSRTSCATSRSRWPRP